jgi:hypothetical protein
MEILALAERGHDPEHRALLVERDGTVAGLVLYGIIVGTIGAAKVHAAMLAPGVSANVGIRLLDAAATQMRADGARFLIAEMPDDPALHAPADLLRTCGFVEESRVPDFYRDGVALCFLRREL